MLEFLKRKKHEETEDPNDTVNRMQFDQVYLYKYALMMAIQELNNYQPDKKFQDMWNFYIEEAGAYIMNVNDSETFGPLKSLRVIKEKDNTNDKDA